MDSQETTAVHSPLFPLQTSSLFPGEQGLNTQNTWGKAGGVKGRAQRRVFGRQVDQLALSLCFWKGEGERAYHRGLRTLSMEHGGSWCIWLSTSFSFFPLWINPLLALFWALGQMVILWAEAAEKCTRAPESSSCPPIYQWCDFSKVICSFLILKSLPGGGRGSLRYSLFKKYEWDIRSKVDNT